MKAHSDVLETPVGENDLKKVCWTALVRQGSGDVRAEPRVGPARCNYATEST